MLTLHFETPTGLASLSGPVDASELDPSELRGVSGGMIQIPAVVGTALWILVGIGGLAVAGIVVGVGIYAWTHRH